MTAEQFGGFIRTIAASGFGLIVGKGWIDAETATMLAGVVGTLAIAAWSWWAKK